LPDDTGAEVHLAMQRRPGGAKRPGGGGAAAKPPAAAEGEADAAPDAPAASAKPSAKPKPRKPIEATPLETTAPTGIGTAPRRWFVASRFDHRAHRDMSCVQCHAKLNDLEGLRDRVVTRLKEKNVDSPSAKDLFKVKNLDKLTLLEDDALAKSVRAVTRTEEVLSPGMSWTIEHHGRPTPGSQSPVEFSTQACTDCHKRDAGGQRFATAGCVACHAYHDHSQEQFPDGRPDPRVAAPVAAAPAPAVAAPAAQAKPAPAESAPAGDAPADLAPGEPAPADPAPTDPAPGDDPAAGAPAPDPAAEAPADTAAPAEEAPPGEAAPAEEPAPAEEAPPPARKSRRPRGPGA
jgi:hypothetical protein